MSNRIDELIQDIDNLTNACNYYFNKLEDIKKLITDNDNYFTEDILKIINDKRSN